MLKEQEAFAERKAKGMAELEASRAIQRQVLAERRAYVDAQRGKSAEVADCYSLRQHGATRGNFIIRAETIANAKKLGNCDYK
ncbi:hypothetical protein WKW79_35935 [Variovorax robiniae]|uniref:Uncharacterized protein n=1 Tax=Variovorax robiniae TaxID=1836199 RepID=A0ABU8XLK9_9BURK